MRFHSQLATNALQRLEWLTTGLSTGGLSRLAVAQSVNAIDSITADLKRQVVNDGLGVPVGSEEELVFRTARMIIDTQLGDLEQALHRILAAHLPATAKPDMWRGLLKTLPLAKAELWRVTRIWLPYRRGEPTILDPSHPAAYKLALRSAFEELDRMDDIPEVERVLYRGIAAARWPDVVSACEQILVAMHVRVDIDATRRIWTARSQWAHAVGSR